jgi:hypothetical protein
MATFVTTHIINTIPRGRNRLTANNHQPNSQQTFAYYVNTQAEWCVKQGISDAGNIKTNPANGCIRFWL